MENKLEKTLNSLDPDFLGQISFILKKIKKAYFVYGGSSFRLQFKELPNFSVEEQMDVITFLHKQWVIYIPIDEDEVPFGIMKLNGISFRESDGVTIIPNQDAFLQFCDLFFNLTEGTNGKNRVSYSQEKSILYVDDKKVKFKKYSDSDAMLQTLINSDDPYYSPGNPIDLGTINELIMTEGLYTEIKDLYAARRNINEQAKKKIGVTDFLHLVDGMVTIDPKYYQN